MGGRLSVHPSIAYTSCALLPLEQRAGAREVRPCADERQAAAPAVEGDRGDEGAEALAPGHHAALAQAEHRHQVVLAARRHIAAVAAPRAAHQAAVVALRSAPACSHQGAARH